MDRTRSIRETFGPAAAYAASAVHRSGPISRPCGPRRVFGAESALLRGRPAGRPV